MIVVPKSQEFTFSFDPLNVVKQRANENLFSKIEKKNTKRNNNRESISPFTQKRKHKLIFVIISDF